MQDFARLQGLDALVSQDEIGLAIRYSQDGILHRLQLCVILLK